MSIGQSKFISSTLTSCFLKLILIKGSLLNWLFSNLISSTKLKTPLHSPRVALTGSISSNALPANDFGARDTKQNALWFINGKVSLYNKDGEHLTLLLKKCGVSSPLSPKTLKGSRTVRVFPAISVKSSLIKSSMNPSMSIDGVVHEHTNVFAPVLTHESACTLSALKINFEKSATALLMLSSSKTASTCILSPVFTTSPSRPSTPPMPLITTLTDFGLPSSTITSLESLLATIFPSLSFESTSMKTLTFPPSAKSTSFQAHFHMSTTFEQESAAITILGACNIISEGLTPASSLKVAVNILFCSLAKFWPSTTLLEAKDSITGPALSSPKFLLSCVFILFPELSAASTVMVLAPAPSGSKLMFHEHVVTWFTVSPHIPFTLLKSSFLFR